MFKLWKRGRKSQPSGGGERSPSPAARPPVSGGEAGAGPASAGPAEGDSPDTGRPSRTCRRRSSAERERLLTEFAASGLPATVFAEQHGIRESTFTGWLRRENSPRVAQPKCRRFTPEERRGAVEAFQKSGRKREDFAKLWGCSPSSLDKWLRRYEAEGPKGLETRRPVPTRREPPANRLPDAARAQIVAVRAEHPDFGALRVSNHLARFCGLEISPSTVRNVLREAGVPAQAAPPKKPRRGPKPPRRFERAQPGELWQSDITSYVLRRQGRRVYFTVFLDDHSRFIVAWALATHQRTELVTEPLLEGIARFGKPKEVLTDQGRQYYAWRGKSAFARLLAKEGIAHVVSRAHHPETLGKCERLWKSVGEEFWDRAEPQDLDDARRRIAHWIRHYNFFRPHQGIDGLVPADRFFGAESTLREALERELQANELRLALDQTPRTPVYLTGQIGEQRIALHGERGRLVIDTPDGGRRELKMKDLGIARTTEDETEKDHGRADETAGDDIESGSEAQAAREDGSQAHELQDDAAPGLAGAGPVGGGSGGGEGAGAHDLHGDPRILARQEAEGRSGERSGGVAPARVAAQPTGALGDDGGSSGAAPAPGGALGLRGPRGRDAGGAEAPRERAGEEAGADGGPGAGAALRPVGEPEHGVESEGRLEQCERPAQSEEKASDESASRSTREGGSERSSERSSIPGRLWRRWVKRTE